MTMTFELLAPKHTRRIQETGIIYRHILCFSCIFSKGVQCWR